MFLPTNLHAILLITNLLTFLFFHSVWQRSGFRRGDGQGRVLQVNEEIRETSQAQSMDTAYYWQVQGQLLVTGMSWCDFVVSAQDDVFIQRIQRDEGMMLTMKRGIDMFFFHVYMDKYLAVAWIVDFILADDSCKSYVTND